MELKSENESAEGRTSFRSKYYLKGLSDAIRNDAVNYTDFLLNKSKCSDNEDSGDCKQHELQHPIAESFDAEKDVVKINWRYGPARLWYDKLGVPPDATTVDYGFKVKITEENEENRSSRFPDEAFLMVTQQTWEDDVLWDSGPYRDKIMSRLHNPRIFTGWMLKKFSNQFYSLDSGPLRNGNVIPATFRQNFLRQTAQGWYSSLPLVALDNQDEMWEERVIWDSQAMPRLPGPSTSYVVAADYFREQTTLEQVRPGCMAGAPTQTISRESDRFNISNDNFYDYDDPRDYTRRPHFLALIQHADVVLRFEHPYILVNVSIAMCRTFHRNLLTSRVPFHYTAPQYLLALSDTETQIDPLLSDPDFGDQINIQVDLTGLNGDILLVEWAEQYPLFINEVGMCSAILNYFKRHSSSNKPPPDSECLRYGCTAVVHQTPFIAEITPGIYYTALENNMYRAPIYEHQIPETDFMVIKIKNNYFVREFNALFAAGRQSPFMLIPSPTSLETKDVKNNILLVYIFRLFRKSPYNPQVISMSDLKKKFPSVPEQMYRTKLNMCATYRKVDHDGLTGFQWVLKPDFRLPTETEMQCMVSPEQYCAYFSMLAAHQRLKDSGLGCKFFMRDSHKQYIESELSRAPWNITSHHLMATRDNFRLGLEEADTGAGGRRGGSRTVGVLRRILEPKENMTVKEATEFLRLLGVGPNITKKLSNWDILEAARTAKKNLRSTKFKKFCKKSVHHKNGQNNTNHTNNSNHANNTNHGNNSINTNNAINANKTIVAHNANNTNNNNTERLIISKKARYKREFQRTFEIQRTKLSDPQILNSDVTDEYSTSTGEEEEIERLGKLVEYRLTNKQPTGDKSIIKKLKRKRGHPPGFPCSKKIRKVESTRKVNSKPDQILKITRTVKDRDGREIEDIEYVRDPRVINMYMAIRTTKDKKFIDEFIGADDLKKRRDRKSNKPRALKRRSELKTERPKTYIKKQHALTGNGKELDSKKKKTPKVKIVPPLKINLNKPVEVKPSTYVKKKQAIKQEPVETISAPKKGYQPRNSYKRRDPVVMFCGILDEILIKVRKEIFAKPFLVAVNPKHYPDYYIKIEHPMDLLSILEKIRNQNYTTREMFLSDINQMVENSTIYNGLESCFTKDAIKVLDACVEKLSEREEDLIELEKMINPLLDHDQAAISFIFTNVLNKLRVLPDSRPFWKAVDKIKYKDYYDIIKKPMDMDTIAKNLKDQSYQTAAQFISEFELIIANSDIYNGSESVYSQCARGLMKSAIEALSGVKDYIAVLEENIRRLNEEQDVNMSDQTGILNTDNENDILKNTQIIVKEPITPEPDVMIKMGNGFPETSPNEKLENNDSELNDTIIEEYSNTVDTNCAQSSNTSSFYVRMEDADQTYSYTSTIPALFESIDIEEIQF